MPVPLLALLAGGAGILGGGQYLLNKQDAANAQEKAKGLMDWLPQSGIAPAALPGIMAQAQAEAEGADGSFMDRGSTRRVNEMWEQANVASIQQAQQTANMQAQQAQWNTMNQEAQRKAMWDMHRQGTLDTETFINQIQTDQTRAREQFGAAQKGMIPIMKRFEEGSITPMEAYEGSLRALQAMFPGEAIMEGDFAALREAGGWQAEFAQMLMYAGTGAGPDQEWMEGIRGIMNRAYDASKADWDAADAAGRRDAQALGVDYGRVGGYGGVQPEWRRAKGSEDRNETVRGVPQYLAKPLTFEEKVQRLVPPR